MYALASKANPCRLQKLGCAGFIELSRAGFKNLSAQVSKASQASLRRLPKLARAGFKSLSAQASKASPCRLQKLVCAGFKS